MRVLCSWRILLHFVYCVFLIGTCVLGNRNGDYTINNNHIEKCSDNSCKYAERDSFGHWKEHSTCNSCYKLFDGKSDTALKVLPQLQDVKLNFTLSQLHRIKTIRFKGIYWLSDRTNITSHFTVQGINGESTAFFHVHDNEWQEFVPHVNARRISAMIYASGVLITELELTGSIVAPPASQPSTYDKNTEHKIKTTPISYKITEQKTTVDEAIFAPQPITKTDNLVLDPAIIGVVILVAVLAFVINIVGVFFIYKKCILSRAPELQHDHQSIVGKSCQRTSATSSMALGMPPSSSGLSHIEKECYRKQRMSMNEPPIYEPISENEYLEPVSTMSFPPPRPSLNRDLPPLPSEADAKNEVERKESLPVYDSQPIVTNTDEVSTMEQAVKQQQSPSADSNYLAPRSTALPSNLPDSYSEPKSRLTEQDDYIEMKGSKS